jgi:hypothetical protein
MVFHNQEFELRGKIQFPKTPCSFSFLCVPPEFSPRTNWIHRYMSCPQTYANWLTIWQSLQKPIFPFPKPKGFTFQLPTVPYRPGQVPDPFMHRKEAAELFQEYFFRSESIRARIRALIRHRRRRIMDQRLIGEVDVGNLELIPDHHKVRVYDWQSKAVYQFHTHTIHRNIANALRYQTFCISIPKEPKNPYTNVPWSVPQLLVLIDQIHGNLWRARQRHMDSVLQSYRVCRLNMELFTMRVGSQLDIECARAFFRDTHGEEWYIVYSETLDEIETLCCLQLNPLIRQKLLDRTFPSVLLGQWDDLVLGFWGYQNLTRMITSAGSIFDLIASAKILADRTNEYVKTVRKKATQQKDGCT